MYYFREGLYFEEGQLANEDVVTPYAFTEDLDRYYHFQEGIVSSGEKPRLKIPEDYKMLVRKIEATDQIGFSEVTTALLEFSTETMEDILSHIERARQASFSDGRGHDFTLLFPPLSLGLTISTSTNGKSERFNKVNDYCALKMYQLKHKKWIHLAIDYKEGQDSYKFRLFDQDWAFDAQMEETLKFFRRNLIDQFFASGNKLGRNDLCPCNSGIKYKKCCGSNVGKF